MLHEVKFSTYIDTKKYVEEIDLNEFIKCNLFQFDFLLNVFFLSVNSIHQSSTSIWSQSS